MLTAFENPASFMLHHVWFLLCLKKSIVMSSCTRGNGGMKLAEQNESENKNAKSLMCCAKRNGSRTFSFYLGMVVNVDLFIATFSDEHSANKILITIYT